MQNLLRFFLFSFLGLTALFAQRNIGTVDVVAENKTRAVRISANVASLNQLAQQAFRSHGRYRVVSNGFMFDARFELVSPNQVRVVVKRSSGEQVLSQTVTGANARNALLKAADVVVEQTNGQGLKGFFASKLAFIGERTGKKEVYTSDLFFGDVKQITRDNSQALTPRWSADGGKLIYTSYFRSGFPYIFQIDLQNYQRTSFVSFKGTNSGARYSPSGQQVAMVLSGEGNAEIYVGNAQGRQIRRLTRTDAVEASPSFSPDGRQLVFTSDAAGGPQLYTMSVAGGAIRRVPTNISRYCAEPDWNRINENKIAFTMGIGRGFQVGVYDFAKRKSEQVSRAPYDAVEPCWLADGRHLVYTQRDQRTSRIYILDTESGRSTALTPANFGPAVQANAWPR